MGMFDYLQCKMPMERDHNSRTFQTKDFDCQLNMIVIESNGRLLPCNSGEHDSFTGSFTFYDYRALKDGKDLPYITGGMEYDAEWVEYEATAVNGVVNQIALVKDTLEKVNKKTPDAGKSYD